MWTLYGLVITGILVGNLTSALTASVAFTLHEVDLYQAQVSIQILSFLIFLSYVVGEQEMFNLNIGRGST